MHSDAQDKTIDNVICKNEERGAALAIVLIVLVLLFAISMSVLATVSTEIGIASSDLSEKPAFYAAFFYLSNCSYK
jgi:Tfp pilus assembly protein PilX